jgi:hypothetical protein
MAVSTQFVTTVEHGNKCKSSWSVSHACCCIKAGSLVTLGGYIQVVIHWYKPSTEGGVGPRLVSSGMHVVCLVYLETVDFVRVVILVF